MRPGDGDGSASSSASRRRRRPEPSPTQRALGLLTRREHSRRELTRKLIARGVDPGDAEQTIVKLTDAGWQDDTRFAESLVRCRAEAGYGPAFIRSELGMHGLGQPAVAAALATFEGDWAERAKALVCRRFGDLGPQGLQQQRKAADLLLRRGFRMEQVRGLLDGDWDSSE